MSSSCAGAPVLLCAGRRGDDRAGGRRAPSEWRRRLACAAGQCTPGAQRRSVGCTLRGGVFAEKPRRSNQRACGRCFFMSTRTLPEHALPSWRRAVLKVGSNLLAADGGGLTPRYAQALAAFIAASQRAGREVVLVSSGAVAAGRALLRERAALGPELAARQALAALGQAPMIALWQSLSECPVAQVLLTHDDLRNRRRYLNARATLRELLMLGVLPVVNENDTVAVDELKLG